MNKILEVKNLTVKYGENVALENVSFILNSGDFMGLVGPNGAGKSTLIKAILGLIPIDSGKVIMFSNLTKDYSKIGYLPQKTSNISKIFPVSVEESILLGLLSKKKHPKTFNSEDYKKVEKILKRLQIFKLAKKLISELSGGQQQRVLLARALVSEPEILIFDEPSTALDPKARESFYNLIKSLNTENGTTVILITHDTGYIGDAANRLLYLDSKVVFDGKISDYCKGAITDSCFERKDKHIIWHQHD